MWTAIRRRIQCQVSDRHDKELFQNRPLWKTLKIHFLAREPEAAADLSADAVRSAIPALAARQYVQKALCIFLRELQPCRGQPRIPSRCTMSMVESRCARLAPEGLPSAPDSRSACRVGHQLGEFVQNAIDPFDMAAPCSMVLT